MELQKQVSHMTITLETHDDTGETVEDDVLQDLVEAMKKYTVLPKGWLLYIITAITYGPFTLHYQNSS